MVVFSGEDQSVDLKGADNQKTPIREITNRSILCCPMDAPIHHAAQLMWENKCSSIIIVDDKEAPQGIWTEGDALAADFSSEEMLGRSISEVMSTPVRTIDHNLSVEDVGAKFRAGNFRHFLVVDDEDAPIGVVSQTDVILSQGMEHYLFLKTVGSILKNPLLSLFENETVLDTAAKMREVKVDALAVRNEAGTCIGIVTERDIIRTIARKEIDVTIGDICSKPMRSIAHNATLLQARSILSEYHIRHLGVHNSNGNIIGILSFSDILCSVEQQYVEQLRGMLRDRDEALKSSSQNLHLAQKIIESSLDAIMITDANAIIEYVNKAFIKLTGYSSEEAVGKTPTMLNSGKQNKSFYAAMWEKINKEGGWQGELWNRRKNGDIYPEKLTINAIYNAEGDAVQYAAIFSDISDRKLYEDQIQNLAYYDILTALPNRRLFNDRLEQAVLQARRHKLNPAVLFLDLDRFKRINDTLGHSVGDRVLKEISERLQSCLRGGDSVSRLGGDEFTILLRELDGVENAAKLAQRLLKEVSRPLFVDESEFYLSASIGVSVFPFDGEDGETLVRNADTAMYKAKDNGRNNFQLYTRSMNEEFYKKLSLENHIRRAVQHDQFFMVYQPKTDPKTGKTASLEALARWDHPDLGLISPGEFIPVSEAMGVITEMGEIFLKKVCNQWRQWVSVGLPKIPVAVNLSMHHFKQENLAENLIKIVKDNGMDPSYLEFEITESTFMDHIDKVVNELNILRDHGVKVSIDDFGTGYSSFSYLKRIPIDTLKIDKSFVEEITTSEDGAEIVSAIIAMAHQLKLEVVAEGVETEEELAFLKERNCDFIQGYIYAKPMSASQVIKYLKD